MREFIEVKINNPIKVQYNLDGKNDFIELDTLYLKGFNKKNHQNITLLLRNKYKRMMLSNLSLFSKLIADKPQEKQKLEESEEIQSIIEVLSVCDGEELISFYAKFKEFLINDIAFKDESFKQKFNLLELELLENDDFELVVANYVAFFFIASWMK